MSKQHPESPESPEVDNGTRAPSDDLRCPKCSAGTLRPSRRRRSDWLKTIIGLKPFRCSRCNARVYRK